MHKLVVFHFQITEDFEEVPVQSRGFGILDVGYRSQVSASLSFQDFSCFRIANVRRYGTVPQAI